LDIEKMLRRVIGEDIEFTTKLASNLGRVKADQGQIEQVLMNLVVNSRDAMPTGGRLFIETANVELDENYVRQHPVTIPGWYVLLSVTDTGAGMDAETQAHIFEPFFTTKDVGKGTGLGLATVYGVVKQSGGYIWADSELGHGTTFKIYLPQVGEQVHADERIPTLAAASQSAETILLVEDEDSLRALTRTFLSNSGYSILEAASAARALEISQQYKGSIHLLLTDVVMPGMSGPELSAKLLAARPEMKVLLMSGYSSEAIMHRGMIGDQTRLLLKPFAKASLLRSVSEVLQADKSLSNT
jgi:CheY-like chemotaxis protein